MHTFNEFCYFLYKHFYIFFVFFINNNMGQLLSCLCNREIPNIKFKFNFVCCKGKLIEEENDEIDANIRYEIEDGELDDGGGSELLRQNGICEEVDKA